MFRRDQRGISGTRTVRLGNSEITISGRLDRSDVRTIRQFLAEAEDYYRTAGYGDSGDLGEDVSQAAAILGQATQSPYAQQIAGQLGPYGSQALDYLGQGASLVGQIASAPPGTVLPELVGQYGNAAMAAAGGDPAAIAALAHAGIDPAFAQTVAQITSPDPGARAAASARVRNLSAAAAGGDPQAGAIREGLQGQFAQHQANLLRDLQLELASDRAQINALRQRLAAYGDPLATAPQRRIGDVGITSGPAITPGLQRAVEGALARTRYSPQPSFRLRRRGGRA